MGRLDDKIVGFQKVVEDRPKKRRVAGAENGGLQPNHPAAADVALQGRHRLQKTGLKSLRAGVVEVEDDDAVGSQVNRRKLARVEDGVAEAGIADGRRNNRPSPRIVGLEDGEVLRSPLTLTVAEVDEVRGQITVVIGLKPDRQT